MAGPVGGMYGNGGVARAAARQPASACRRRGASVARAPRHPASYSRRSGASVPTAAAARVEAGARVGGVEGGGVAAGAGGRVVGGGRGGGVVEGGGGGPGAARAAGGIVEVGEAGAARAREPLGRSPEAGVAVHPSLILNHADTNHWAKPCKLGTTGIIWCTVRYTLQSYHYCFGSAGSESESPCTTDSGSGSWI